MNATQTIQERIPLLLLFSFVFLLRASFLIIAPGGTVQSNRAWRGDELNYVALASRLAESNFTSYLVPGDSADQRRTPVLPFVASILMKLAGQGTGFRVLIVAVQCLFFAAALCITCHAFGLERPAPLLAAGALSLLDLVILGLCDSALTEPIYAFLLSLVLWFCVRFHGSQDWRKLITLSICLGLLVLTRPIAQFLILLVPLTAFFSIRRGHENAAKTCTALFLVATVLPTLFGVRNFIVHNKFFLSEIAKVNVYRYWAPALLAKAQGRSFEAVQKEFDIRFEEASKDFGINATDRQHYFAANSLPIVRQHLAMIPTFVPQGFYRLLAGKGSHEFQVLVGKAPVGLMQNLKQSPLSPTTFVIVGENLALLATYLIAITGVLVLAKRKRVTFPVLLGLMLVLYHIALCWGPEATARFRAPVVPILIAVGLHGLSLLRVPKSIAGEKANSITEL